MNLPFEKCHGIENGRNLRGKYRGCEIV